MQLDAALRGERAQRVVHAPFGTSGTETEALAHARLDLVTRRRAGLDQLEDEHAERLAVRTHVSARHRFALPFGLTFAFAFSAAETLASAFRISMPSSLHAAVQPWP